MISTVFVDTFGDTGSSGEVPVSLIKRAAYKIWSRVVALNVVSSRPDE
jgi:hypothetical protein